MKKHEISLNKANKELKVKVWGMFESEDAANFIADFKETVSTIQPSETALSFDTTELKVSKQEMMPMLEGCFNMYKDFGFQKVSIETENNAILKMQLNRVAKKIGLAIELF